MNFNKDLINHLDGQHISRAMSEAKNIAGRIADELAPGTSKDISKGVMAEDAMGRASFSLLQNSSQSELGRIVECLTKKLGLEEHHYGTTFREACTVDGQLDNKFVSIAEEFTKLGEAKPEKLKFVWEGYIPELTKMTKKSDGSINKEKYDAIKELLKDDKISTRGIPEIISGCTEWIKKSNGDWSEHFNKKIFEKYKELTPINGTSMHEQDDVFTLYIGRIFNACKKEGSWLREGESEIVDEVALNYAKRLYEQGQDIIHMDFYLKNYHTFAKDGNREVCTGFDFTPTTYSRSSEVMMQDLKNSLGRGLWGENILKACEIDGSPNLHNLLCADTLLKSGKLESPSSVEYIMKDLKDEKGIVDTTALSHLLQSPLEKIYGFHAEYLKSCMHKNGAIDRDLLHELSAGKLAWIDYARVDGELNYPNINFIRKMMSVPKEDKFQEYQFREVFNHLRNKDGIVDEALFEPLCELKKYTHLAPERLANCMDETGKVNRELFDLMKEILTKKDYPDTYLWQYCRNEDKSLNLNGLQAVKLMLGSKNMNSLYDSGPKVVNTFSLNGQIDLPQLEKFIKENEDIDIHLLHKILHASFTKEKTLDLEKFNTLKRIMKSPELEPLMEIQANAKVIDAKFSPETMKIGENGDRWLEYSMAHLRPSDIEVLEKNGFPARFYKMLGIGESKSMSIKPKALKEFEETFIKGSLDDTIAGLDLSKNISLGSSREALGRDLDDVLKTLPEQQQADLTRAFNISFDNGVIEGFPRYFEEGTVAPTGMEQGFNQINKLMQRFYSGGIKSDSPELQKTVDEIIKGFPEFSMVIGKTGQDGSRVDIKTLEQLKKLINSPEYKSMSSEDKSVSKMTVLLNSLEQIDSKSSIIKRQFMSDNDGLAVYINADWKKSSDYANSVLERYGMSDKAKYRVTQLLNDLGWAEKLKSGELTPYDVAVNTRFKGDEVVSPLLEKVIKGSSDINMEAVGKETKLIHQNQQLLLHTTMKELEPYIETTKVNGQTLKYIDLDRAELRDKSFIAHFLGYDNFDYTLNLFKNKAYRSGWSASMIRGGEHSSCFAGRNCGIILSTDMENVAHTSSSNIESGFGKQYDHLKNALKNSYDKEVKATVKDELNLTDSEYGELMAHIQKNDGEITDCVINGRRISKQEIEKAHKNGRDNIFAYNDQNEVTILNPTPIATIGIGESLDCYEVSHAVNMAQANDMVMLFKRRYS